MADFDIGDKVKHKVFGEGDCRGYYWPWDSSKLTIAFDEIDDRKVIMSTYVKLLK